MSMKRLLLVLGAGATLAAGCGDSGSSSSTTGPAGDTASHGASALVPLLLRDGDLPGYTAAGRPETATDPDEWAALNHTPTDAGRLKALAFVAGARVDLKSA